MSKSKKKEYQKFENLAKNKAQEPIPATWLQIGATGSSDELLAKIIPADQMFGTDIPECFPDRLAFFRWWIFRSIMLKNLSILYKNKMPKDIQEVLDALESNPEQAYSLFCKHPFIFDVKKQFKQEAKIICDKQAKKVAEDKQKYEAVKKWLSEWVNHEDKSKDKDDDLY